MTAHAMHRHSFLTLLGGASAAAWPLVARGRRALLSCAPRCTSARDENDDLAVDLIREPPVSRAPSSEPS